MAIRVSDSISLELLKNDHAGDLIDLIDANRLYLKEWLPWVDSMQAIENARNHIADCKRHEREKTDLAYAIFLKKNMVGRIGIHNINQQNKIGEIGYWLADGLQGNGIITQCCIALIQYGFSDLGLNRIVIKCATGNHKSRAIAERLNFKLEGIIRQGELLNEKFIDLYQYALLKDEWEKANS